MPPQIRINIKAPPKPAQKPAESQPVAPQSQLIQPNAHISSTTNTNKRQKLNDDDIDDDMSSDDEWGPMPLLPPKSDTPSVITATNTPTSQPTSETPFDGNPSAIKRTFQADWDDDDAYSSSDEDTFNPLVADASSNTPQIPNAKDTSAKQVALHSLFHFDTAITFPLPHHKFITSLSTSLLKPTSDSSSINNFTGRNNSIDDDDEANTGTSQRYAFKIDTGTRIRDDFNRLLIHCGCSNAVLSTLDFSSTIFPSTLHVTELNDAILDQSSGSAISKGVHSIIPINHHYNPNPDLIRYDFKQNKALAKAQIRKPITFMLLTHTNKLIFLSQQHEIISKTKVGFPYIQQPENNDGHIAPINAVTFSPTVTTPQGPGNPHNYVNFLVNYLSKANLLILNRTIQYNVVKLWKQSYNDLQLNRTSFFTGGDDNHIRLWSFDIPHNEKLPGHLQYYFEHCSDLSTTIATKSNTSKSYIVYKFEYNEIHDIQTIQLRMNTTSASTPEIMEMAYNIPRGELKLKLKITALCQINSQYLLVGTKGGLIFCFDLYSNIKRHLWYISPLQYLPLPPGATPLTQPRYDITPNSTANIDFDDTLYIQQIVVISPYQACVVVSGKYSLCFIMSIDNLSTIRPSYEYFNEQSIFYSNELEITSITHTYAQNLPNHYHLHKYPLDSEDISQNTDQLKYNNNDGLIQGLVLGLNVNQDVRTSLHRYQLEIDAYDESVKQAELDKIINAKRLVAAEQERLALELEQLKQSTKDEIKQEEIKQEQREIKTEVKCEVGVDGLVKFEHDEHVPFVTRSIEDDTLEIKNAIRENQKAFSDKLCIANTSDSFISADNIYTMDEIDDVIEAERKMASRNLDERFEFPQLSTIYPYIVNQLDNGDSSVDYDFLPFIPQDNTLTELLFRNYIAQRTHEENNDVRKSGQETPDETIASLLNINSSFVVSFSFNIPSQHDFVEKFKKVAQSNTKANTNTVNPIKKLFSLHPSIQSYAFLPNHNIFSLSWFNSILVIGSKDKLIFLPNTADFLTTETYQNNLINVDNDVYDHINLNTTQKRSYCDTIFQLINKSFTSYLNRKLDNDMVLCDDSFDDISKPRRKKKEQEYVPKQKAENKNTTGVDYATVLQKSGMVAVRQLYKRSEGTSNNMD